MRIWRFSIYSIGFCCTMAVSVTLCKPYYYDYMLHKKMTKLAPVLDTLQQQVVDHVHMHGNFPNDVHLESETNLYAYDVTLWTSSKQTAIMQGMINGRQFGLAPGLGGMFTCLLANRNESVESKCFYQVKQM